MRARSLLIIATVVASALSGAGPSRAVADDTILISIGGGFGPKSNGNSFDPSFSADGRFVAFYTEATNVHPSDTDALGDVYVRDTAADTTTLVSRATGVSGAKGHGNGPAISADGRSVVFNSGATNLHPADMDAGPDVFVRDLETNTTTLVSRASGANGANGNATTFIGHSSISADGRYVVFTTNASNLHPDDTSPDWDVFVRDVALSTTTLVSRADGAAGAKGNANAEHASISADGRHVAFEAIATNLDPTDTDQIIDIFVRDLDAETTTLVTEPSGPAKDLGGVRGPSISADGRYVTFTSWSGTLHPDDTTVDPDVLVRDTTTGDLELVTSEASSTGSESVISADGRFVAYRSLAKLDPADTDNKQDIYVRDLVAGTTTLASRASGALGVKGNDHAFEPGISPDGRFVGYPSWSTNLVPEDTDGLVDIYVRDVRGPQPPPSISISDARKKEGKRGRTKLALTVTMRGTPASSVTVDFSTLDGSATPGNDYLAANGTLIFPPWLHTQTIVVDVIGDKRKEPSEAFQVLLFDASGAPVGDDTGIGTIANDDKKKRRRR